MTGRHAPTAILLPNGGFTLIEMVVAAAVTSVIMLGIGSAMLIAGRAMPQAGSAAVVTLAAAKAAEQMIGELRYAIAISGRSATMIELAVPDRDNNGLSETIRYEWSTVAGAPLIRRYNGGTAVTILPDVREFSLSYDIETIGKEIPQANESAETRLIDYSSSTDLGDYPIKSAEWYGEYFHPTLPAGAISWKVTRVRFFAKQAGLPGGEARVQIHRATIKGLPSGVVLERNTLYESLIPPQYLEYEVAFTQVAGLSPQEGLCLVFKWISDTEACMLLGQNRNVTATNLSLVRSMNQGNTWLKLAGQSLLFSIYGTVTTPGTPQIQNTYYLNAVQIRLRAGSDSQSLVQTAARTLNRPEIVQ